MYARSVSDELLGFSYQIPKAYRDLELVHPDIEFYFTVGDQRSDRDNMGKTYVGYNRAWNLIP